MNESDSSYESNVLGEIVRRLTSFTRTSDCAVADFERELCQHLIRLDQWFLNVFGSRTICGPRAVTATHHLATGKALSTKYHSINTRLDTNMNQMAVRNYSSRFQKPTREITEVQELYNRTRQIQSIAVNTFFCEEK